MNINKKQLVFSNKITTLTKLKYISVQYVYLNVTLCIRL